MVLRNCPKFTTTPDIISCKILSLKFNDCSLISVKVWFRFKPLYHWLNLELDLRFSSANTPNLELNFEFSSRGSGSNLSSEPNFSNTILEKGADVNKQENVGLHSRQHHIEVMR